MILAVASKITISISAYQGSYSSDLVDLEPPKHTVTYKFTSSNIPW